MVFFMPGVCVPYFIVGAQKREKSRAALFSVAAYCLKSGGGGGI